MKTVFKLLVALVAASALLEGCAVYGPPYAAPVYAQPGYYGQPAPVYVQPAPVYVGPPVTFGFNFGWWGGGHHH